MVSFKNNSLCPGICMHLLGKLPCSFEYLFAASKFTSANKKQIITTAASSPTVRKKHWDNLNILSLQTKNIYQQNIESLPLLQCDLVFVALLQDTPRNSIFIEFSIAFFALLVVRVGQGLVLVRQKIVLKLLFMAIAWTITFTTEAADKCLVRIIGFGSRIKHFLVWKQATLL